MEKEAIKELIYGGLKEIMDNQRYYHKSLAGRQYSGFSDHGEVAVREFIREMAGFIAEAEDAALNERAKQMTLNTLKGD